MAAEPETKKVSPWKKLGSSSPVWEKDDLAEFFHWAKQGLGVLVGLLCGVLAVQGFAGFALFAAAAFFGTVTITRKLEAEEVYDSVFEAVQEGFMPGMFTFILVWALTYTGVHF
eukprot:GDKI01041406.1.p2 GENE.GDKI01041406.1~~GDKI01041406.1.p2  ORF type:complete len:114 (-),score=25.64 GDKI01041406.1:143-484(-)